MSKFYKFSLMCAALITLGSCSSDKEKDIVEPATSDAITYTAIDANTSDLPIKAGMIISRDAEFTYEENSPVNLTPPYGFVLPKEVYWAHFSGQVGNSPDVPIHGSIINGSAMCMNGLTDCDDKKVSTIWNLQGQLPSTRSLKWEFINENKSKGYKVEMTNLPVPAFLEDAPTNISSKSNITFRYMRNAANDSISIGIIFVPNSEEPKVHNNPTTHFGMVVLPGASVSGLVTLSGKTLREIIQKSGRYSATDSVYLNLMTQRSVLKIIENKKILITYKINDIRPITLEGFFDE